MTFTKYKKYGSGFSSEEETHSKSGAQLTTMLMKQSPSIGALFFCTIIFSAFFAIFIYGTGNCSSNLSILPSSSTLEPVSVSSSNAPVTQWLYHQSADPMGKGTIYLARVSSSNTVNFDFPYSGAQHATLTLRTHPRHGKDVIFGIEKGQILCRSYEDCTVLVRFDDESPSNYSAIGAADNSTKIIFIRNYSRFLEKLLKAKRIRISVNIYQESAPVFEFDVNGFDQSQYKPKK